MPTPDWCSWFSGLVDGEGCFALRHNRKQWVAAELRINMRADDRPMLAAIKATLGFGRLTFHMKRSGGSKPTVEFCVGHRRDLLTLVRLFDQYPLRSRKRKDYEVWRTFVLLHQDRKHANDPRVEELLHEIKSVRVFSEGHDA